ncbi:MAG: prepilin-type N-terminal cleavage/methylation domain-containing protein [Pseudobutyrivibrio sp.]|nr:prepilin-type N-terminal cleavage/methylation domain-containing protein [Pseudobutyrivibrio sp.]
MNDKGFTLIELISVIAIMVVLIAIISLSFSSVDSMRVDEVSEQYHTGLETAQTIVMARNGGHIVLSDDGKYYQMNIYDADGTIRDSKQIGSSEHITIKYYIKGSGGDMTEKSISDEALDITYDTVSGAFKFAPDNTVSSVVFSNGRKSRTITLYANTGKNILE